MNVLKQFEELVIDLKKRTKGLKFKTWLIFTSFAGAILLILWGLQTALIKPYYRSAKVNAIKDLSDKVETMLINNAAVPNFSNLAAENGVCIQVTNYNGYTNIYNAMGDACYFEVVSKNKEEREEYKLFLEEINQSIYHEAEKFIEYNGDIAVYGKRIDMPLGGFYLLINGYVTPEKAGFTLIQNQFFILVLLVLILATIASLFLSERISYPLISMTNSAKKLGHGDFDVQFKEKETLFTYEELHQLQETLDFATKELSKTDELRRDLLANVSHDIKTPLTMVMTYAEMIKEFSKNEPEKMMEHLDIIIDEAMFMEQLINDMLELSKMESEVNALNYSYFDLIEFTEAQLEHFIEFYPDFKFEFISPDKPVIVRADRVKIAQVLNNFLNNAIKFSHDHKEIHVIISEINGLVQVSVKDFGIGIQESEINMVWDRYYQINKNHARDKGSGLGLAIAKTIIDKHGGTYGVISHFEEGSEFYFSLKKVEED